MNMLVAMASPRSAVATAVASIVRVASSPARAVIAAIEPPRRQREVGVAGELAGIGLVGVEEDPRPARDGSRRASAPSRPPPCRRRGCASAPPAATRIALIPAGRGAMRTWLVTGPPFCARPGHVDHPGALALEMRRHGEDRADRHHPGAADAGDQHREAVGELRRRHGSGRAKSTSVDALMRAARRGR